MIYGSSRIQVITADNVPGANLGPSGNRGPTGFTGITGITGITGNTGATANGITGATVISGSIVFQGSTLSFTFENITGPTGTSYSGAHYRIRGVGEIKPSVSSSIVLNNFTEGPINIPAFIKSITMAGFGPIGVVPQTRFVGVSFDNQMIYLFGATVSDAEIALGNTGELLYVNGDAGFGTTPLKAKAAPGTKLVQDEKQLFVNFKTTRESIFNNKAWNADGNSEYLFSNFTDGLTYYLGVSGNTFGTSVLQNKTLPQIEFNSPYFTLDYERPLGISYTESIIIGFTLGGTMERLNFISLSGISKGNSYSPQNYTRDKIGSCCFCKTSLTDKVCLDYVSSAFCSAVSGVFSTEPCITRDSSSDCYYEGACCVYNSETGESNCINTTSERCAQFGGVFNEARQCEQVWVNGVLFECPPDLCNIGENEIGKCCVSGRCFNLGQGDCNSVAGAIFVGGGTCESQESDSDCCSISYQVEGACCVGSNGDCSNNVRPDECIDIGGIFQGPGTTCREVTCCGYSFAPDYFIGSKANNCKAYSQQQLYSCLRPGDKIGGGYFVSFIGMPNPCSSFNQPNLAHGEPLECLCNPRGSLINQRDWPLKTCKGGTGNDNSGAIDYFARTYPKILPKNSLDSRCLLKAGVPNIQQAYILDGIQWPSELMFEGTFAYNPSRAYAYSIEEHGLASETFDTYETFYKNLAKTVYRENNQDPKYQILWALIVAPEDIEVGSTPDGTTGGNRLLSWGMMQGSHQRLPNGAPDPDRLVKEPVPTFPVDGLLTTRIHDGTSRNNPQLWFRDPVGDSNAYNRFSFGNGSAWASWVNEEEITTDINAFKVAYSDMWARNNPVHSAIYQVTSINAAGFYGHNDWYIPSIIELNYIYSNVFDINSAMLVNGDQVLFGKEYWSSTSVSRLLSWNENDPLNKDFYVLENLDSSIEPYLSGNTITSSSSVYEMTENEAYQFRMAVSNGQKMLTQNFEYNNELKRGMIRSRMRSSRVAHFRPVRRIPLVVTCDGFYFSGDILNSYWESNPNLAPNGCASCLDHIEGMCS